MFDPNSKVEYVLGYTLLRLTQDKAIPLLGMAEEDVVLETAEILGPLGVTGWRRRFSIVMHSKKLPYEGGMHIMFTKGAQFISLSSMVSTKVL